jgi:hypothetical protein
MFPVAAELRWCSSPGAKPYHLSCSPYDRLCGLVVTVPGCLPRGPGFDPLRYQIFCVAVGLERGPLSLMRINEELLERKSSGSGLEN